MRLARRFGLVVLLSSCPWAAKGEGISHQDAVLTDGTAGAQTNPRFQMNFRSAPLDQVLDYLSSAAGFIIHKAANPSGTFDFWSKDFLTKEEALDLINSVMKRSGFALIASGRILTVVSLDAVKTADLEVVAGNNPDGVNKSDEVITQIVPVRYVNAAQLVNNLQPLLPFGTSLSANESANALVLVASKTVVRRMLRIVAALDTSMATVTSLKVFPLRYADAKQLAGVIQPFFSAPTASSGMNPTFNFGPPDFGGPPSAGQDNPGTVRNAPAAKVVATADETSNSLIVSAAASTLEAIAEIVRQVDRPVSAATEVRLFKLRNTDPAEMAERLAQLFPDNSKNSSDQEQDAPVFGGPPGPGGPGGFAGPAGLAAEDGNSGDGNRVRTRGRVIAAADPRTSSLLVSASSALMPQIAKVIEDLDANRARREIVKVYELQNADPQDVNQVLQDLFNRNNSMRNNNNNNRSLLGQSNPLSTRATQQQTSSPSSGLGNAGGQGTGGGPGSAGGPNGP